MATTIIPIEIAELLHTAIKAEVGADVFVYARGVPTDDEGNADDSATGVERKCPMVGIIPTDGEPQQHASVLWSYPVHIRVMTYGPHDPFAVSLYTISDAVGKYLRNPPALAMTLAEFDAMVVDGPPEMGNVGKDDTMQYQEWACTVNVRKA